jgi:hypothetical protein
MISVIFLVNNSGTPEAYSRGQLSGVFKMCVNTCFFLKRNTLIIKRMGKFFLVQYILPTTRKEHLKKNVETSDVVLK